MPYREKVDLLRAITQELEQFQAPANGRSVERRKTGPVEVMEVHEAGCVTATPEPVPEPAPSTEIVR